MIQRDATRWKLQAILWLTKRREGKRNRSLSGLWMHEEVKHGSFQISKESFKAGVLTFFIGLSNPLVYDTARPY